MADTTPTNTVSEGQHHGATQQLCTPEQKEKFYEMVSNTLQDHNLTEVEPEADISDDVMLSVMLRIKTWATAPVSWVGIKDVVDSVVQNKDRETAKNIKAVFRNGYELAAKGEYPEKAPNPLSRQKRDVLENKMSQFFKNSQRYYIEGNEDHNENVQYKAEYAREYLATSGLPATFTLATLPEIAKRCCCASNQIQDDFIKAMTVEYKKLSGQEAARLYVPMTVENGIFL